VKDGVGVMFWPDGTKYEGDFQNDHPHGYGRKIFSNGEYYEESLVNYKVVNNKFEQYGFSKPTIIPFDACLDNYKDRADLDQDDIKFASLYMGVIMSLNENKSTKG
jgi:hypothetical protein